MDECSDPRLSTKEEDQTSRRPRSRPPRWPPHEGSPVPPRPATAPAPPSSSSSSSSGMGDLRDKSNPAHWAQRRREQLLRRVSLSTSSSSSLSSSSTTTSLSYHDRLSSPSPSSSSSSSLLSLLSLPSPPPTFPIEEEEIEALDLHRVVNEEWLRRKGNLGKGVELSGVTHLGLQRVDAPSVAGLDCLGELAPGLQSLSFSLRSRVPSLRDLGVSIGRTLRSLDLTGCGLQGLEGVAALPLLRELYVSHNAIGDLAPLLMHEHLEILDVAANPLARLTALDLLASCPQLRALTLQGTPLRQAMLAAAAFTCSNRSGGSSRSRRQEEEQQRQTDATGASSSSGGGSSGSSHRVVGRGEKEKRQQRRRQGDTTTVVASDDSRDESKCDSGSSRPYPERERSSRDSEAGGKEAAYRRMVASVLPQLKLLDGRKLHVSAAPAVAVRPALAGGDTTTTTTTTAAQPPPPLPLPAGVFERVHLELRRMESKGEEEEEERGDEEKGDR